MDNQQPTILIIDDEPANLRVLKQILQQDYRLIFAKSGSEALRLAHSKTPNLILLDIMMPDITGLEVCKQLKKDVATAKIPVIFVTALNDHNDEAQGLELGAVDYITKPVSAAVVKARVATHLSLVQADELKRTRLQVIQRLGHAAEYKDNEIMFEYNVDRIYHALRDKQIRANRYWDAQRKQTGYGASVRIICEKGTLIGYTEQDTKPKTGV